MGVVVFRAVQREDGRTTADHMVVLVGNDWAMTYDVPSAYQPWRLNPAPDWPALGLRRGAPVVAA